MIQVKFEIINFVSGFQASREISITDKVILEKHTLARDLEAVTDAVDWYVKEWKKALKGTGYNQEFSIFVWKYNETTYQQEKCLFRLSQYGGLGVVDRIYSIPNPSKEQVAGRRDIADPSYNENVWLWDNVGVKDIRIALTTLILSLYV